MTDFSNESVFIRYTPERDTADASKLHLPL